jgi:hypothetical protein
MTSFARTRSTRRERCREVLVERRENVFVHIAAAAAASRRVFSTKLYGQRERERWGGDRQRRNGRGQSFEANRWWTTTAQHTHTLTQGESSFSFQIFFPNVFFFFFRLSLLVSLVSMASHNNTLCSSVSLSLSLFPLSLDLLSLSAQSAGLAAPVRTSFFQTPHRLLLLLLLFTFFTFRPLCCRVARIFSSIGFQLFLAWILEIKHFHFDPLDGVCD